MTGYELKGRTWKFALPVMKLMEEMPKTTVGRAIGSQPVRSGTSVGTHYRSACQARSKAEFISKPEIVLEEADESGFWLERIIEGRLLKTDRVTSLINESNELTAIFTTSIKSAKGQEYRPAKFSLN